jgi:transcriptional regulator with XRE-family HTH domain
MSDQTASAEKPVRRNRRAVDVHVGSRIRERRRMLGVSRAELARELSLSIQQVQKYESGDSTVAASRLLEIGARLAVPPAYFFDEMPSSIESNALPRAVHPSDHAPSPKEIRQMVLVYQAITNPELRHQLFELARSLARSVGSEGATP